MARKCYNLTIGTIEDLKKYKASGVLNTTHMNTYSVMADDPDDACNWLIETKRMDADKHVVMLCRVGNIFDQIAAEDVDNIDLNTLMDEIEREEDDEEDEL